MTDLCPESFLSLAEQLADAAQAVTLDCLEQTDNIELSSCVASLP